MPSSRGSKQKPTVSPRQVHAFVDGLFGEDMHAARVGSLAKGVTGVPEASQLGIHAIGRGVAVQGLVDKPTTTNRRLYISSIPDLAAAQAARAVRVHWGVENRLHWVLDVAFREDEARAHKGHAAENLGIVRKLALNFLKQETSVKRGIKTKRLRVGWDHRYLMKILGNWMRSRWGWSNLVVSLGP